jgi:hypothetical protein
MDMVPTWSAILSILNRGKERSFGLSRKRMNRWRGWSPHLEVLEDRDLPSVTAYPTYVLLNQSGGVNPHLGFGPTGTTPSQILHAYGFDQIKFNNGTVAGDGTGETIAIVDAYDDPKAASDLHQFDVQFNLPDPVFTKVNQTGGTKLPQPNTGWAVGAGDSLPLCLGQNHLRIK